MQKTEGEEQKIEGDFGSTGNCWHPIKLEDVPIPTPERGQVLVKILASGFNHRDVWQRKNAYPGTIFSTSSTPSILGADTVGVLVSPSTHALHNKRVLIAPAVGWLESPLGPDVEGQPFGILGGVEQTGGRGTYAEYVAVGEDDVIECPEHLGNEGAAAAPLGALTAYRAVFTKSNVKKGDNVLITGIGGGVRSHFSLCNFVPRQELKFGFHLLPKTRSRKLSNWARKVE